MKIIKLKPINLHPELGDPGENCECYGCVFRDGYNNAIEKIIKINEPNTERNYKDV